MGLALLGTLAVAAGPGVAQQPRRPYRVGVLNEAWAANHPTVEGLKAGLRELGLEEGRDVQAAHGNQEAMDGFARVNAGVTSPREFFSEENVQRIFAATRRDRVGSDPIPGQR